MKENKIFFKGILGGLQVNIDPHMDWDILKKQLKEKLESNKNFFQGSNVNLVFTGRNFNDKEKQDLKDFIKKEINNSNVDFRSSVVKEDINMDEPIYGTDEGMARFFRGTVRNGQRIDYQGNIIIMGDVNPGAEIIAGGNIIVLGNLRGMAHAGATGDLKAVVVALRLQPTQLRIGNIITRSPEDEVEKPDYPEIAYIRGDNLFIEPYTPGKVKY
ncbi:MAG: septum site-determining protein MinC [Clostridiales bacterium]|nr:septum site-determining protein MinC [Clostridiales bacterium]